MSAELWSEVENNFLALFPNANAAFRQDFAQLRDASKSPDELVGIILKLIEQLQKG
jgi:hypothetical protein